MVDAVVGRCLECGVLEAGFARVHCDGCKAEYLLAFSCKTRYFCPSCHAKRLAEWTLWLGDELLAPVPHRQMVFTLPKRLRPYFLWRRKLLGDLARVAAGTATAFVHDAGRGGVVGGDRALDPDARVAVEQNRTSTRS